MRKRANTRSRRRPSQRTTKPTPSLSAARARWIAARSLTAVLSSSSPQKSARRNTPSNATFRSSPFRASKAGAIALRRSAMRRKSIPAPAPSTSSRKSAAPSKMRAHGLTFRSINSTLSKRTIALRSPNTWPSITWGSPPPAKVGRLSRTATSLWAASCRSIQAAASSAWVIPSAPPAYAWRSMRGNKPQAKPVTIKSKAPAMCKR